MGHYRLFQWTTAHPDGADARLELADTHGASGEAHDDDLGHEAQRKRDSSIAEPERVLR
jgi:hypothetical protein